MNAKLMVLLGSVGAIHLVAGGLFLAGGCTQEDPPMPPGIYVPRQPAAERPAAVSEPTGPAYPSTGPVIEPSPVMEPQPAAPAPETEVREKTASNDSGHGDKVYIVVKNDSLWLIARKNGLIIEELASYNQLPANAKLKIGQKLYIPAAGKKTIKSKPAAKAKPGKAKSSAGKGKSSGKKTVSGKQGKNLPADGIYTVKAGDNFSKIAKRHGLKVSDLMNANPGVDSSRLKIGQKLRLSADSAQIPAPKKTTAQKAAAPKAAGPSAKEKTAAPDTAAKPNSAKPDDVDDLLNKVDDVKTDSKAEDASSNAAVKAVISEQNDPLSATPDKDKVRSSSKE